MQIKKTEKKPVTPIDPKPVDEVTMDAQRKKIAIYCRVASDVDEQKIPKGEDNNECNENS